MRAELLARTRAFFAERGFLEVETPLLSADTVIDRHLDPLSVVLPPIRSDRTWAVSFGCKRRPSLA